MTTKEITEKLRQLVKDGGNLEAASGRTVDFDWRLSLVTELERRATPTDAHFTSTTLIEEIAELRRLVDEVRAEYQMREAEIAGLKAENAKLKGLLEKAAQHGDVLYVNECKQCGGAIFITKDRELSIKRRHEHVEWSGSHFVMTPTVQYADH